jgi:ABC-type lipoprotein release transport system permease subunit
VKPGITYIQANDQMNRVAKALDEQYPKREPGWRVQVVTLLTHLVGKVRGWMLMRRASLLILAGLAVGSVGSWFLSSTVKRFLFEVQPNDIGIFLGALGVLAATGLAASAVPARRAAGVDPLVALRCE